MLPSSWASSCSCELKVLWQAGEIIPQALCSRYGLQIGSYSSWFVRALIIAVWVIAYPISKVLDYLLGTEHGVRMPWLPSQSCSTA